MRLIELIKLFMENKDIILEIIEFLRELGLFKQDEVFAMSAEALDAKMVGRSDTFIEIVTYLVENREVALEFYKLLQKFVSGE